MFKISLVVVWRDGEEGNNLLEVRRRRPINRKEECTEAEEVNNQVRH